MQRLRARGVLTEAQIGGFEFELYAAGEAARIRRLISRGIGIALALTGGIMTGAGAFVDGDDDVSAQHRLDLFIVGGTLLAASAIEIVASFIPEGIEGDCADYSRGVAPVLDDDEPAVRASVSAFATPQGGGVALLGAF